jgi:alkanesulfonate monooxygenase SsuD/methylene tetrahydromethanopterin reductase-like flavin-dependent oxidoreductase (luciferase family)
MSGRYFGADEDEPDARDGVKVGVHLPLMEFRGEGQSLRRLTETVDAAREHGLDVVSSNDHFVFSTPWLDGLAALAAATQHSGDMTVATTVALSAVRGPVPLAKSLAAIDILSEGRLIAGVGPGSSQRDYDVVGLSFDDRWKRFEESVVVLRGLLRGETVPPTRYFPVPESPLMPRPHRDTGIPLWIGSWGSDAGLSRVARLADGWLASAYNTTPEQFAAAKASLAQKLAERSRDAAGFPNGLATMWTWVTEDGAEAARMRTEMLAPLLGRDPDELADRLCIGSAEHCARLLSDYARAGCDWVQLWLLGDERRQIELLSTVVIPQVG